MKSLVQTLVIYSFSLYLLSILFEGVKVSGGFLSYIVGGIILRIMFLLLKPVLNLISLPLNLVTMGAFSFVINAIILYLLTLFLSNISIKAFIFKGFSLGGFVVPTFYVNTFFAFLFASLILSVIISLLTWIIKK